MNFYPVLIPTLCRYEHFKRCLLSLEKNPLAKETTVYIALDYPLKDEHWAGYEKIKEFLNGKFNFKELVIIKREKNFGAFINCDCASEDLYKDYNAVICSEDDNEFSPNFLEYMNICLEKYENDNSVIAIGGYSFPVKWKTDGNNVLRSSFCTAWGFGIWKNKRDSFNNVNSTQLWNRIKSIKSAIKLTLKSPYIFCHAMTKIYAGKKLKYDLGYSSYMLFFDKYMIYPVISKVRNWGCDGSGVNWQLPDDSVAKLEIDSESHFEIKGNDSAFIKENEAIFNKFWGYNKILLLKIIVKYFLLKFKIRKIPSDA